MANETQSATASYRIGQQGESFLIQRKSVKSDKWIDLITKPSLEEAQAFIERKVATDKFVITQATN